MPPPRSGPPTHTRSGHNVVRHGQRANAPNMRACPHVLISATGGLQRECRIALAAQIAAPRHRPIPEAHLLAKLDLAREAGPGLTTSATASAPSMFVANKMPTPQWSLQKCSRVSAAQVLVVRVRALPRCTAHMRCGGARCITVGAQAGATACQALQPRRRQHTPSSWKLPRSTSSRSTRGPRGAPCLRTRSAKGVQKYQQK